MCRLGLAVFIALFTVACQVQAPRQWSGTALTSRHYPELQVEVAPSFMFAGKISKGILHTYDNVNIPTSFGAETYVFIDHDGIFVQRVLLFEFLQLHDPSASFQDVFADNLFMERGQTAFNEEIYSYLVYIPDQPEDYIRNFLANRGYILPPDLFVYKLGKIYGHADKHLAAVTYLEDLQMYVQGDAEKEKIKTGYMSTGDYQEVVHRLKKRFQASVAETR